MKAENEVKDKQSEDRKDMNGEGSGRRAKGKHVHIPCRIPALKTYKSVCKVVL